MKTLKQLNGFTAIELLVVLVVVGILSGLIITTHKSIAQKDRNTTRQRDVAELRDEMEAYYSQYNKYPLLSDANSAKWRATNMKGVDNDIFHDPSGTSDKLAARPAVGVYAYMVTSASGAACNNTTVVCVQYTITATLEGGGTYVKNNLN